MLWWLLGLALVTLLVARAGPEAYVLWGALLVSAWQARRAEAALAELRQRLAALEQATRPVAPRADEPALRLDEDLLVALAPGTADGSASVAPPPAGPLSEAPQPPRATSAPAGQTGLGLSRDPVAQGLEALRRFFAEGNAPVKVGLLVLLAGIGALLKYAADQDWLSFPPAWRLLALTGVALGVFGFGWRQRRARPVFALTLQGGAIAVLYLVLFAALRLYHLVAPGPAFVGFVALAGFGLVLAVRQSAQLIAGLAALGGFAAPLLASTGSGGHVVLFGFYAVLNGLVFAAAWWRAWRGLNLLGFGATFVVGLAWGHRYYDPAYFSTVEPFLVLFFLFYVAVGLLYARHRPTARGWWVDATLVFGTPLLAFGLQVALLAGADRPLAWSALGVAVVQGALAAWLWRRPGATALATSYALIAAAFAALAVPLAFGASWTHGLWALQGLAVLWLGIAQQRPRLRIAGTLLMLAAGLAWLWYLVVVGSGAGLASVRLSGAVVIAFGAFGGAYLLDRQGEGARLASVLFGYGWLAYLIAGLDQIQVHATGAEGAHALALLGGLAAALAAVATVTLTWPRARRAAGLALLATAPVAVLAVLTGGFPMTAFGYVAWLGYAVVALALCRVLPLGGVPQAAAWLALVLVASAEAFWRTPGGFQSGLAVAAAGLPWLACLALAWRSPQALVWPARADGRERRLVLVLGAGLALWLAVGAASPGALPGWPFYPLVNPLEAAQVIGWLLLWPVVARAAAGDTRAAIQPLLLVLGLLVLTAATLRGVHQLADLPWSGRLWHERLTQAALAIVWTALGIGAMVIGARRLHRPLWIGGAGLAGLVVAKLLLVDRHYLGDLAGIVAFLGVGTLLVAVGYLAPAPPRASGVARNQGGATRR